MEYILLCLNTRKTFNLMEVFSTFSDAIETRKSANDVEKLKRLTKGGFYATSQFFRPQVPWQ